MTAGSAADKPSPALSVAGARTGETGLLLNDVLQTAGDPRASHVLTAIGRDDRPERRHTRERRRRPEQQLRPRTYACHLITHQPPQPPQTRDQVVGDRAPGRTDTATQMGPEGLQQRGVMIGHDPANLSRTGPSFASASTGLAAHRTSRPDVVQTRVRIHCHVLVGEVGDQTFEEPRPRDQQTHRPCVVVEHPGRRDVARHQACVLPLEKSTSRINQPGSQRGPDAEITYRHPGSQVRTGTCGSQPDPFAKRVADVSEMLVDRPDLTCARLTCADPTRPALA